MMITKMLWPKEAGKLIAQKAKDVKIVEDGIKSCAQIIATAAQNKKLDNFSQNEVLPANDTLTLEQLNNWTFFIDALNFSFWTSKGAPKFQVTHNGKTRLGYLGMVNAVNRALDEGKPMYDPRYYSSLTVEDMRHIFRSDNASSSMPLLEKRVEIASQIGKTLVEEYNGTFDTIVGKANGSAIRLVEMVLAAFPSFRDIHTFDGQDVAILKRAQILAADLELLHKIKGQGPLFHDIDDLSMFADYRVPQSLVHFGAIAYSTSLMKKLQEEYLFDSGDREEVEIRGVSIHAVELIVQKAREILSENNIQDVTVNSVTTDYFLWDYRMQNADDLEAIPYHKTRCIYY